jgi:ABC-2 type transport system permease protein
MRNVLIIIHREFLERVRTKSFVLGTVLFPVFMVALVFLPAVVRTGGGERTLVLVDAGPAGIGEQVAAALEAPREDRDAIRYTVQRTVEPAEGSREALNARVERNEIDGYVVIGPDVLESSEVSYRARDVTRIQVVQDLEQAVTAAVRQERLRDRGLTAAQVAELVRGVRVQASRISGRDGEERGNLMATLMTSYVLMFLFIQIIALYGQNAMRSVLEEKNNRIVEVIVSSVKPTHLMAGKILGLASVALLQIGIWGTFVALLASQSAFLSTRFGVGPGAFAALQLQPVVWAVLLVFFGLGFVLYAAMYAAAGASVTSEQEAQQLAFPLMLPLFVPIAFIMPVLTDPLGTTARTLSMIPFSAPVVMPMRAVATDVPAWEIAASIALLVLGVALVVWIAGKIYRVGILSTGKKPTLRELVRWLRMA